MAPTRRQFVALAHILCLAGRAVASKLRELGLQADSGRDVKQMLDTGQPEASRLTHEAGRRIGEVMATVVSMINPDTLLIGGDLASTALIGGIRETLYPRSLPRATHNIAITFSTLGDQSAVIGGTRLIVNDVYGAKAVNRRFSA